MRNINFDADVAWKSGPPLTFFGSVKVYVATWLLLIAAHLLPGGGEMTITIDGK